MNNYKFGNYICKLREDKGFTQADLAAKIDVSDKAVSKWENGQAFPRIETLEKLAAELNTSVEDIFSASKDGVSRVCIVNNFGSVLHIDINGQLYSIRFDESKWVELDRQDIVVKITVDLFSDSDMEEFEKEMSGSFTEKFLAKGFKKVMKYIDTIALQVDCDYIIKGIKSDTVLTIELDDFDLDDKTWCYQDFYIVYPKIRCEATSIELLKAKGQNVKQVIKKYQKMGLEADLGRGFLIMFLAYPIRGLYFRHMCKPHILKKNIENAEIYKQKSEKRKKGKKLGCLSSMLVFVLVLVGWFLLDCFVLSVVFVESEKPYLVAEDYSTITYGEVVYTRIEELPDSAVPTTIFDATIWEDARTDGFSKWDQSMQDNKVQLFEDRQGRQYLWLVENYTDSDVFLEDKEYDDFDEHYVYVCEDPK